MVAGAHQHPFNLSQWGAFLWSARDRICLVISQAGPATGVPGASSPSCLHRGICCCQPAPRIVSVVVDCVPRCLPFLLRPLLRPYSPPAALRSDRTEEVACVMRKRLQEKALSFFFLSCFFQYVILSYKMAIKIQVTTIKFLFCYVRIFACWIINNKHFFFLEIVILESDDLFLRLIRKAKKNCNADNG